MPSNAISYKVVVNKQYSRIYDIVVKETIYKNFSNLNWKEIVRRSIWDKENKASRAIYQIDCASDAETKRSYLVYRLCGTEGSSNK